MSILRSLIDYNRTVAPQDQAQVSTMQNQMATRSTAEIVSVLGDRESLSGNIVSIIRQIEQIEKDSSKRDENILRDLTNRIKRLVEDDRRLARDNIKEQLKQIQNNNKKTIYNNIQTIQTNSVQNIKQTKGVLEEALQNALRNNAKNKENSNRNALPARVVRELPALPSPDRPTEDARFEDEDTIVNGPRGAARSVFGERLRRMREKSPVMQMFERMREQERQRRDTELLEGTARTGFNGRAIAENIVGARNKVSAANVGGAALIANEISPTLTKVLGVSAIGLNKMVDGLQWYLDKTKKGETPEFETPDIGEDIRQPPTVDFTTPERESSTVEALVEQRREDARDDSARQEFADSVTGKMDIMIDHLKAIRENTKDSIMDNVVYDPSRGGRGGRGGRGPRGARGARGTGRFGGGVRSAAGRVGTVATGAAGAARAGGGAALRAGGGLLARGALAAAPLLMNPLGLGALAIGGLAAGGVYAYKKWKEKKAAEAAMPPQGMTMDQVSASEPPPKPFDPSAEITARSAPSVNTIESPIAQATTLKHTIDRYAGQNTEALTMVSKAIKEDRVDASGFIYSDKARTKRVMPEDFRKTIEKPVPVSDTTPPQATATVVEGTVQSAQRAAQKRKQQDNQSLIQPIVATKTGGNVTNNTTIVNKTEHSGSSLKRVQNRDMMTAHDW